MGRCFSRGSSVPTHRDLSRGYCLLRRIGIGDFAVYALEFGCCVTCFAVFQIAVGEKRIIVVDSLLGAVGYDAYHSMLEATI